MGVPAMTRAAFNKIADGLNEVLAAVAPRTWYGFIDEILAGGDGPDEVPDMTLPPERIGDKGQRYHVRAHSADGGTLGIGYSPDLPGAERMAAAMRLHPTYNRPEVIDRRPPRHWFKVMGALPYVQVDFAVVARYRARIEDNHGQTLERLNERGGLDFYELWCGLHDKPLFPEQTRDAALMRDDVLRIVTAGATEPVLPEGPA